MNEEVMAAIREWAEAIVNDTEDLKDALQYVDEMTLDVMVDCALDYQKDSDAYGVLHKACYTAIHDAAKRKA